MKKAAIFFIAVIAVAALSAVCTWRWMNCRSSAPAMEAHEWLHRELKLTTAQNDALEPIEAKFTEKQRLLTEQLRVANCDLARIMGEDKAYTPRVAAAVEVINHRMSDLQKAAIEHIFDMRSALAPQQGDQLLNLAQHSLEQTP